MRSRGAAHARRLLKILHLTLPTHAGFCVPQTSRFAPSGRLRRQQCSQTGLVRSLWCCT